MREGTLRRRLTSWRGLGLFWVAVLSAAALGAAALQSLDSVKSAGGTVQAAVPTAEIPNAEVSKAEVSKAGVLAAEAPRPEPEPEVRPVQATVSPATVRRVAAPDPGLLEPAPHEPTARVPRVASDGRTARVVYAAAAGVVPAGSSRIALIVSGVGRSEKETQAAIMGLPGAVSLAVSAYASMRPAVLDAARAAGHELLASVPMEPEGYPQNDEGPQSLMTGTTPDRNALNLEWALSRVEGAVGATGASDGMRGERFAEVGGVMDPVVDEIARRGLMYLDPRPGRSASRPDLYSCSVDVVIDNPPARAEVDAKLATLERIAREKGVAVGLVGQLQPVTLERLAKWTKALAGRGFVLVPVSSVVTDPRRAPNAIASH